MQTKLGYDELPRKWGADASWPFAVEQRTSGLSSVASAMRAIVW